jgi:hypothetical protein
MAGYHIGGRTGQVAAAPVSCSGGGLALIAYLKVVDSRTGPPPDDPTETSLTL